MTAPRSADYVGADDGASCPQAPVTDPKPLIYVAGPYTKPDPVINTREACLVADYLVAWGAAVVVPHLSLLWHAISPASVDAWYARDLDVLRHCHAVVLLPGESLGADREIAYARSWRIPVYAWGQPLAEKLVRGFIADWRP